MHANMTEYLRINLDTEMWECRNCDNELISAHENYKRGLLVHDRPPHEIHDPLLDPKKYEYTFCPDPKYTAILEFCCPHCGTLIEVEYTCRKMYLPVRRTLVSTLVQPNWYNQNWHSRGCPNCYLR